MMHNVISPELMPSIAFQAVCALRLALACLCGAAVGFERSRRQKEAGVRTHVVVALGSCLATVVSKYGYFDVVINESMQVDVSRIASNLLPSIAFLGAGLIFHRGSSIRGLTTAAGIWATAAIGLAMGTGLYLVGGAATLFIVFIHMLFHSRYNSNRTATILMRYPKDEDIPPNLKQEVEQQFHCRVRSIDAKRTDTGSIHISLEVHANAHTSLDTLSLDLLKNPHFRGLDM